MARALVVDDNQTSAFLVGRVLRERGFEVEALHSPLLVDELLSRWVPDIVIADWRMPWMTGIELLAVVKRRCPDALRILVTGSPEELRSDDLEPLRPVLMFAKPVDFERLVDAVTEWRDTNAER